MSYSFFSGSLLFDFRCTLFTLYLYCLLFNSKEFVDRVQEGHSGAELVGSWTCEIGKYQDDAGEAVFMNIIQ